MRVASLLLLVSKFRVTAALVALTVPKTPRLAGCGATSPLFFCPPGIGRRPRAPLPGIYWRVSAASRRTIGTNVSKSTGFGTCRSNPAAMAAATSPFDT
jgi:hypothetical protein